jgi:stage V sporulation protein G
MGNIEVTGITIRPFASEDEKLKAFASIILNNCFVIKDLKVIEGNNGRFVAMPSRRGKDGVFHDIAHPLNQETRDLVENAVLEAYEKEAAGGGLENSTHLDSFGESERHRQTG